MGGTNPLQDLIREWREEADRLEERYGATQLAMLSRAHAVEVEQIVVSQVTRLVSPDEAADISGYSKSQLRRLVREGKLTNHGRKGVPRYRVSELPQKPTNSSEQEPDEEPGEEAETERGYRPAPGGE